MLNSVKNNLRAWEAKEAFDIVSKKKYLYEKKIYRIQIHQHNCICRFASREGWSLSSWNCEIWHSNTDMRSEIPRAVDIDINGSRHTCTSLCAWIECSTSLERNHYITSKQRKVAVFFSTFAWEYGSTSVIPRLYSICLYVVYVCRAIRDIALRRNINVNYCIRSSQ